MRRSSASNCRSSRASSTSSRTRRASRTWPSVPLPERHAIVAASMPSVGLRLDVAIVCGEPLADPFDVAIGFAARAIRVGACRLRAARRRLRPSLTRSRCRGPGGCRGTPAGPCRPAASPCRNSRGGSHSRTRRASRADRLASARSTPVCDSLMRCRSTASSGCDGRRSSTCRVSAAAGTRVVARAAVDALRRRSSARA